MIERMWLFEGDPALIYLRVVSAGAVVAIFAMAAIGLFLR